MLKIDLTESKQTLENVYHEDDYKEVWDAFKDPATKYCREVLSGQIIASYKIRLSCFRQVRDLQRQLDDDPEFNYVYDLNKVRLILFFASETPNPDTGKPFELMNWQQYILSLSKGWRRKTDLSKPRYTRAIISIGRGQGKTMIEAILMLYSFLIEGEGKSNQDYLVTAPTAVQLTKMWDYMISVANVLKEIKMFKPIFEKSSIVIQETQIRSIKTRSKIVKISDESGRFESFHAVYAVADEYAETNGANAGKITSGMMLTGGSFVQISTAKDNPNVPFRTQQLSMVTQMEKDYSRELDDFLVLVWEQDNLDEIKPENSDLWVKSNPLLYHEDLREQLLTSLKGELMNKTADGTLVDMITRNFNMWHVDKAKMFLSIDDINDAVTTEEFDIEGRDCYIGFDFSINDDDTSLVFDFPYIENGKRMHYITHHSFIPTSAVHGDIRLKEKRDEIKYRAEEKNGYATIARNNEGMVDVDVVFDWLMEFIEMHQLNVIYFIYDFFRTEKIIKMLESNGSLNLIPLKQDVYHLNSPTKELRTMFIKKQIKIVDSDIARTSLQHAQLSDENNAIRLDKARKSAKIDFAAALVDVISESMYYWDDYDGHEENSSKKVFGNQSSKKIDEYFTKEFSF